MTRRRRWRPPPRSRLLAAALLAAVVAAVLAAPAFGKEDVQATLTEPVPLGAAPGQEITVAWTLTYEEEAGEVQPFGAQGVYVTLVSATGGDYTTGHAGDGGGIGRYEAAVTVPEGGIGGIQIALMGWANAEPAPVAFPIVNNPLPDLTGETLLPVAAVEEPALPRPPVETDGGPGVVWLALGLAAVLAVAALGVVLMRRRRPLSSA
jgi:hypothetical protein